MCSECAYYAKTNRRRVCTSGSTGRRHKKSVRGKTVCKAFIEKEDDPLKLAILTVERERRGGE